MLRIQNLFITYGNDQIPAVKDFSLEIGPGEIIGIVGESGSGKTSVVRAVLGCLPATGRIAFGDICYEGKSILHNTQEEWRAMRGTELSMIFQDNGVMLNPIRRIGAQFVEYIRTHRDISKEDAWGMGEEMLQKMRLLDVDRIMKSYPFQLSGGMRQRVGIAMAMTFSPRLLLVDEPTSALDATTQAQIVRQMMELRETEHTAIVLVTHNLGVAAYMSDRILVMKEGSIVDQGDKKEILTSSSDIYTKQLLESVPSLGGTRFV